MAKNITILLLISVAVSSCSSIPKVLQGEYSTLSPYEAKQNHIVMEVVRWSGQIIQVINDQDKTCFVVINSQTDSSLRPLKIVPQKGSRFIACKPDFLEPQAFNNKLVTITGTISKYTIEKVGEYNYEYPVVTADKIYIWNQPRSYPTKYAPIILVNRSFYFCRFNKIGMCI
jgi:outer membrane lipoprotein